MPEHSRNIQTAQLMSEREVAQMLNCSAKTLRNDRSMGRGPKWVKIGRLVRYRIEDVLAYIDANPGGIVTLLLICGNELLLF
jgi:predicted DNA-binding transcriptional regulator AlpA